MTDLDLITLTAAILRQGVESRGGMCTTARAVEAALEVRHEARRQLGGTAFDAMGDAIRAAQEALAEARAQQNEAARLRALLERVAVEGAWDDSPETNGYVIPNELGHAIREEIDGTD